MRTKHFSFGLLLIFVALPWGEEGSWILLLGACRHVSVAGRPDDYDVKERV